MWAGRRFHGWHPDMSVEAITKDYFQKALDANRVWDFGNDVLYTLCRDHPNHDDAAQIVAKTWLIGRSYAVSLERRSGLEVDSDVLYVKHIVPIFQNAGLDQRLKNFTPQRKRTASSSLALHKILVDALGEIGEEARRSFASKYLHFHCPEHFFIYDSRAAASARKLAGRLDRRDKRRMSSEDCDPGHSEDCDPDYADFFYRCERLTRCLALTIGRSPTPRELDKLLLFHHAQ